MRAPQCLERTSAHPRTRRAPRTHEHDQRALERQGAAACFLVERIGDEFGGFVTGASRKGTWVRALDPPVEGRVVEGAGELDVGDAVRVRLVDADPERGFIDFAVIS